MTETREKILDHAEKLFGEQGYAATSLRQIIADAGVNLAAIHYHFGSKEELLDEIMMRKAGPVNDERLALLDRFEAEAGTHAPAAEKVLEAFLGPPFSKAEHDPDFVRMMGRLYGEGLMPTIVERHFQPVVTRFLAALHRALPQLPDQEMALRIQFMVGAMAHTMFGVPLGRSGSAAAVLRELVAFVGAGFRAPATCGHPAEKIEVRK